MLDLDFHFLRPWALLFIPYALWNHFRLRRAYSATIQWQGAIAPELLEHLTVAGRRRRRLRPYQLMTVLLVLMSLTVAGPAWDREITPFTQDRAPLVIAIELTPSMLATDQQPTRLEGDPALGSLGRRLGIVEDPHRAVTLVAEPFGEQL